MYKQLTQWKKKRITLEELENFWAVQNYQTLVALVEEAVQNGELEPMKTSKTNGRVPPLACGYWVRNVEKADEKLSDELKFRLHLELDNSYYLAHLEQYAQERTAVMALNDFWYFNQGALHDKISLNERSFQIWQREKFLQEEGGRQLLRKVGLTLEALNIYQTAEPLAYYTKQKITPQNILVVENKDTFYSMRAHLLGGAETIWQMRIDTLIYGGGKKVCRAMQDMTLCAEDYLLDENNVFYYFGDLDYEGIGIFESLYAVLAPKWLLKPLAAGYQKMLDKSQGLILPETKDRQMAGEIRHFWQAFTQTEQKMMQMILQKRRYIPQEIVNQRDF